jgi:hypothetical protein
VAGVLVRTEIDAPPIDVWRVVSSIPDHVAWMDDAIGIEITSPRSTGVGATFDCETRVGPIELTDHMEVTEWVEGRTIGVAHTGVVSGSGRFTLVEAPDGRTVFSWEETLHFPWWLGGPLGEVVGARVLRRIWTRNLASLATEVARARSSSLRPR